MGGLFFSFNYYNLSRGSDIIPLCFTEPNQRSHFLIIPLRDLLSRVTYRARGGTKMITRRTCSLFCRGARWAKWRGSDIIPLCFTEPNQSSQFLVIPRRDLLSRVTYRTGVPCLRMPSRLDDAKRALITLLRKLGLAFGCSVSVTRSKR